MRRGLGLLCFLDCLVVLFVDVYWYVVVEGYLVYYVWLVVVVVDCVVLGCVIVLDCYVVGLLVLVYGVF